ncbi:glycoside hydrolase family 18 protein [Crassisporium funariophilum]|nr:glycoside hydrolase family 18 protein [Crassisporium funariophilum]
MSLLAALSLCLPTFVTAAPLCGLVPPQTAASRSLQNTTPPKNASETENVIATGWYPGWLGAQLAPSAISWEKYSALTFAFALTTPDPAVISMDDQSAALLPTFVSEAQSHGVGATLSIGGWTGSIYFSTAVNSAENRTIFVKAVVDIANQYSLDGIDFDWEYPNHQGIGCNMISPDDSANFLLFLQELRQDPDGAKLTLSAAVGLTPFAGPDGTPMADVSGFAQVLDHIAIMDYDVWGSWSATVGPNAPLDDSCAPAKAGSATSAVQAWTTAQFPASKVRTMRLPKFPQALTLTHFPASYGHSFHVDASAAMGTSGSLALYPPFDKSLQPLGDSDVPDAPASVDQCGNPSSGPGGTFNFKGMIAAGFLDAGGAAATGIDYLFDNCSQTPFVYKPDAQTLISYDDATSFRAKGKFINDNSLGGYAMWHIAGDSDDILLDAINDAMGVVQVCS